MRNLEEIKKKVKIIQEGADGFLCTLKVPKGNACQVVCSLGGGWEHVSVTKKNGKTPTWEEMCYINDIFFQEEEVTIQYHPKKSEYINVHNNCLHIWRQINKEIPTPPMLFV